MHTMNNRDLVDIISRTLGYIDSRLVMHGRRVAYFMIKLLPYTRKYNKAQIQKIGMIALLHDVGAYKTDEIDNLFRFESKNVWRHAIYGYLFLKNFSPLGSLSEAVLYHHVNYNFLNNINSDYKNLAMLLNMADRLDIFTHATGGFDEEAFRSLYQKKMFPGNLIDFFVHANKKDKITDHILDGTYSDEMLKWQEMLCFSEEEVNQYLHMLVYTIDFRSEFTVTHTINTVRISTEIASAMGVEGEELKKIYFGALLHDLGKIAIPLEILESPGRLSAEDMKMMKTHVVITEKIIKDAVDPDICEIAVRHHEKLDGSGYPKGLTGSELTNPQRIVAVADIISALNGKRSYKDVFDKEKIISIITEMSVKEQICPIVADAFLTHYDEILDNAQIHAEKALNLYNSMKLEYGKLYQVLSANNQGENTEK